MLSTSLTDKVLRMLLQDLSNKDITDRENFWCDINVRGSELRNTGKAHQYWLPWLTYSSDQFLHVVYTTELANELLHYAGWKPHV